MVGGGINGAGTTIGGVGSDTIITKLAPSGSRQQQQQEQPQYHHLSSEELDTLIHRKLRGSRSVDGLKATILLLIEEWRKLMASRKVGR